MMAQASGSRSRPTPGMPRGERRRSRRWLRILCLVVGTGAALASALGLGGVMLFSRFGPTMAGPGWWYGLRPLELAGVAPKGPLWWLGLLGWAAIGLVGLVLMGRAANRRRRPRLLSSVLLMVAVCLATAAMARALYVRPGKVLRIASVSRLHQLTGIEFPEGTRLTAGRAKAGPEMVVRAQLTLPAAAVSRLPMADSGIWPGEPAAEPTDRATVLRDLQRDSDEWDMPDWWPELVPLGIAGGMAFGPAGAEWSAVFVADTPTAGQATVYLECRQ